MNKDCGETEEYQSKSNLIGDFTNTKVWKFKRTYRKGQCIQKAQ